MPPPDQTPPQFRLINGGLQKKTRFGELDIIAAPERAQPFAVGARVYEEDTFLIMSADPKNAPEPAHPLRLMAELADLEPEPPGTVVVQGHHPLKLLAIVHDVNQEPTWRKEWIQNALNEVFLTAEKHNISGLALPMLGTRHGRLKTDEFAELLYHALLGASFLQLRRLWLIAPVPENTRLIDLLDHLLPSGDPDDIA